MNNSIIDQKIVKNQNIVNSNYTRLKATVKKDNELMRQNARVPSADVAERNTYYYKESTNILIHVYTILFIIYIVLALIISVQIAYKPYSMLLKCVLIVIVLFFPLYVFNGEKYAMNLFQKIYDFISSFSYRNGYEIPDSEKGLDSQSIQIKPKQIIVQNENPVAISPVSAPAENPVPAIRSLLDVVKYNLEYIIVYEDNPYSYYIPVAKSKLDVVITQVKNKSDIHTTTLLIATISQILVAYGYMYEAAVDERHPTYLQCKETTQKLLNICNMINVEITEKLSRDKTKFTHAYERTNLSNNVFNVNSINYKAKCSQSSITSYDLTYNDNNKREYISYMLYLSFIEEGEYIMAMLGLSILKSFLLKNNDSTQIVINSVDIFNDTNKKTLKTKCKEYLLAKMNHMNTYTLTNKTKNKESSYKTSLNALNRIDTITASEPSFKTFLVSILETGMIIFYDSVNADDDVKNMLYYILGVSDMYSKCLGLSNIPNYILKILNILTATDKDIDEGIQDTGPETFIKTYNDNIAGIFTLTTITTAVYNNINSSIKPGLPSDSTSSSMDSSYTDDSNDNTIIEYIYSIAASSTADALQTESKDISIQNEKNEAIDRIFPLYRPSPTSSNVLQPFVYSMNSDKEPFSPFTQTFTYSFIH